MHFPVILFSFIENMSSNVFELTRRHHTNTKQNMAEIVSSKRSLFTRSPLFVFSCLLVVFMLLPFLTVIEFKKKAWIPNIKRQTDFCIFSNQCILALARSALLPRQNKNNLVFQKTRLLCRPNNTLSCVSQYTRKWFPLLISADQIGILSNLPVTFCCY